MKKKILFGFAAVVFAAVAIVACKRSFEKFDAQATNAGALVDCEPEICEEDICVINRSTVDTLPNIISGNLTLVNTKTWIMKGKVYVADGGQLTIPAGTLIKAIKRTTNDSAAALVVTRGGKLNAEGRADCPIIFTSNQSTPVSGDWGGIVLLGKATTNQTNPTIEGINLPSVPVGIDVHYGGTNDNDTSGKLIYVRIEYAGASIATDNELNGLTCGGVGRGTKLSYIQVYQGNDDAFEFFGGTVNADHLYSYIADDDAFDFDFGYRGTIQFAVSVLSAAADYSSNPNGIESDNSGVCNSTSTPFTRPILSNLTIVGLCDSTASKKPGDVLLNGAHFRKGSLYVFRNSVIMGFPTGILLDTCNNQTLTNSFEIKSNVITAFDRIAWSNFPTPGNVTLDVSNKTWRYGGLSPKSANDSVKLVAPCSIPCPDFRPTAASAAASGANFASFTNATDDDYLITNVSYKGAFNVCTDVEANWLAGWTKH